MYGEHHNTLQSILINESNPLKLGSEMPSDLSVSLAESHREDKDDSAVETAVGSYRWFENSKIQGFEFWNKSNDFNL